MKTGYEYGQKHVHDIRIGRSFVHCWNREGAPDGRMIGESFRLLLDTPWVFPYVALMPDYHPAPGTMVGSVIPTREVVLPTVVGGDIGCGMAALRLNLTREELEPRLEALWRVLAARIPAGTADKRQVLDRVRRLALWDDALYAERMAKRTLSKTMRQVGSLGGGNHFLEVLSDDQGRVWLLLHVGSRALGTLVLNRSLADGARQHAVDGRLYARLPYLRAGTDAAERYLADMNSVMAFARENRVEVMTRALEACAETIPSSGYPADVRSCVIDVVHNYIAREEHFGEVLTVHRKGAIRAGRGEIGMIPGSMGSRSYIVEGRGNAYSFCSCSHGAGRVLSRREAAHRISDGDLRRAMNGTIYDARARLNDEAPQAYKDIRSVLRSQRDLVAIVHELRPLATVKG